MTDTFKVQANTLTEAQFGSLCAKIAELETVDIGSKLNLILQDLEDVKETEEVDEVTLFVGVNNLGGCTFHEESHETFGGVPTVGYDEAVTIVEQLLSA